MGDVARVRNDMNHLEAMLMRPFSKQTNAILFLPDLKDRS